MARGVGSMAARRFKKLLAWLLAIVFFLIFIAGFFWVANFAGVLSLTAGLGVV